MPKDADRVDFAHPDNAGVLAGFEGLEHMPSYVRSAPRGSIDEWELGTHPDLVSTLWDEADAALPKRCAWIVHGVPCLVHPRSGVVFGFAFGTQRLVLRVPSARHTELGLTDADRVRGHRALGGRLFVECELDWVFAPYGPRLVELAKAAYEGVA